MGKYIWGHRSDFAYVAPRLIFRGGLGPPQGAKNQKKNFVFDFFSFFGFVG